MNTLHHKNIINSWKTSVIGIISILAGFYYLFTSEEIDKVIFFGSIGIGIALLLFPDDFIKIFKSFLNRNKNKDL